MLKSITVTAAAIVVATTVTGCNSQTNSLFHKPNTTMAQTPSPVVPAPQTPSIPYTLSAEAAGPFINFTIYNLGQTDMPVDKGSFAIISARDHSIVPYTRESAIIDLPQPAVVKANGSLNGRAMFKQINEPLGKRLVYKPDATGTFADINRPTAQK